MGLNVAILLMITKDLPISPRFTPYDFLSRYRFRILTTRQPMVEFYIPTSTYRRKNTNSGLKRIELTTSALEGVRVNVNQAIDTGMQRLIARAP